jgi:hypothetical protein
MIKAFLGIKDDHLPAGNTAILPGFLTQPDIEE